jgi:predicted nucleic acid-binding protein
MRPIILASPTQNSEAPDFLAKAIALFDGKLARIPHVSVLAITARHGVSAYDARFLALANQLGRRLVTEDKKVSPVELTRECLSRMTSDL